ncbi:hypothetical protein LTR27_009798 [Elasticomyces elasticus]|nr:hypothetical protein LTR27_009798 [Elasticomyces elasticus]
MRIYASVLQERSPRRDRWLSTVLPYFLLLCLALLVALFFGLVVSDWGSRHRTFRCLPNGDLRYPWQHGTSYQSTWDPAQFLQITLGFGHLSFPVAKTIDICWDLVAGRGGQALLVWGCYPLFRRSLTCAMEKRDVATPLFSAIAFDHVSLTSTTTLGSTVVGRRSKSRNWRFALLFLAFTYLLTFPTWMSAVTGYQSHDTAYVKDPADGSLVPTTGWAAPSHLVFDGSRIGLTDDYPLFISNSNLDPVSSFELFKVLVYCYLDSVDVPKRNITASQNNAANTARLNGGETTFVYVPAQPGCNFTLLPNASSITQAVSSSVTIRGTTYDLPHPLLNIYLNVDGPSTVTRLDVNQWYAFGELALTREYLLNHMSCEPAKTYSWGFSSIALFIFCILTVLFATILLVLQQDAFRHGRADRYVSKGTNAYRDAIDLVDELRKKFGDDVQYMPADELERLVEREGGGIGMDTTDMVPSRSESWKTLKPARRGGSANGLPAIRRRFSTSERGLTEFEMKDPSTTAEEDSESRRLFPG